MSDSGTSYDNNAAGWRGRAACTGADPELFVVQTKPSLARAKNNLRLHDTTRRALKYCDVCPVKTECLDDALSETSFAAVGIWGGTHISWTQANKNLAIARREAGWNPKREARRAV